jgi:hypothetical protein
MSAGVTGGIAWLLFVKGCWIAAGFGLRALLLFCGRLLGSLLVWRHLRGPWFCCWFWTAAVF